jgi:hypothetical protein
MNPRLLMPAARLVGKISSEKRIALSFEAVCGNASTHEKSASPKVSDVDFSSFH